MNPARAFDVVVWGATGFTGRLVAEYLFQKYGATGNLKWAMAGRNQAKLEKVRAAVANETVPLIIADSQDRTSLDKMVQSTRAICTTVGPYGKYGSKLVAACVQHQTHYCDLSGEPLWMRTMIDQHHEAAKANGTKIVHCCGFDSIPSDLGVYFIQQQVIAKTGQAATQINMRVKAIAGGVSGGTYASLSDTLEKAQENKNLYKVLLDPYGLNPQDERHGPDQPDLQTVVYDEKAKSWIHPFIMATINTKVVRRSNALADYPYGKDFRYDEAVLSGKGLSGRLKAYSNAIVLGIVASAKPGTITKKLLDKILPDPGEGPSQEKRASGFFNLRFYTTLSDGRLILGKVTGDRDPGYGSTCKMLGESAICLVKDDLPNTAGVLTPSVAMGDALLDRLQANAGLTFTIDF